jgi:hypothetical protein
MSIRGHARVPGCSVCRLFYSTQNPKKRAPHEVTMRSRNTRTLTLTAKRRTREVIRLAERQAAKRRQSAPAESAAPAGVEFPASGPRARRRREKLLVVPANPDARRISLHVGTRSQIILAPVELPPSSPGVRRRAKCRGARQLAAGRDATPAHRQHDAFIGTRKTIYCGRVELRLRSQPFWYLLS